MTRKWNREKKLMNYRRPLPDALLGTGVTLTYTSEEIIEDPVTKIKVPVQVSYMEFQAGNPTNRPVTGTFGPSKLTEELRQIQTKCIDIKHKCIRVAEVLNETLRNFLLRYHESEQGSREEMYAVDFAKLRDKLSLIVKTDQQFRTIDMLSSNQKRKAFTKTFNDFIEDRNIYTHGHLHVRTNDNAVVITFYR